MRRVSWLWRVVGGLMAALVLALLLAISWPLPRLQTFPPQQLGDADSLFVRVGKTDVHYKRSGEGSPTWLLLHGFGASTFSWRELLLPSVLPGTVIAFDRPAFGLTSRQFPGPYGEDDVLELTIALLEEWKVDQVIAVGHSAGVRVALQLASQYPERLSGLVLISPALESSSAPPNFIQRLLHSSWMERPARRLIRRALGSPDQVLQGAWHDDAQLTPQVVQGYALPLKADDWDRALWHFTLASLSRTGETVSLAAVPLPTLVIVGSDDRIIATSTTIEAASSLSHVQLEVLPDCGHVPHEERPDAVIGLLREYFGGRQ